MVVCVIVLFGVMIVDFCGAFFMTMALWCVGTVGSRFGFEGRFEFFYCRFQTNKHFLEYMVFLEAQPARANLQRHMPIAEVVSRAAERERIDTSDLHHLFRLSDHQDNPSVLGAQPIAIAQNRSARQKERCIFPGTERRQQTTFLTLFERQYEFRKGQLGGGQQLLFDDDRHIFPYEMGPAKLSALGEFMRS